MLLYRLALKRWIEYFELDKLFKEDESRLLLLKNKKPKPKYEIKLKTNETLNFYISVLLTVLGILICFSIPFEALESPCDIFLEKNLTTLYAVAKLIERYFVLYDCLIIFLIIALIYVTVKTLDDAIKNTNINISPWIVRGKYKMPTKVKKSDQKKEERTKEEIEYLVQLIKSHQESIKQVQAQLNQM